MRRPRCPLSGRGGAGAFQENSITTPARRTLRRAAFAAPALAALMACASAQAQVTFYENDGYRGRSFVTHRPVDDFTRFGFNDTASSAVVSLDPWQVCEDIEFGGRCVVLRPGRYASLAAMGLNDRLSSARVVRMSGQRGESARAPQDAAPDFRRRDGERLYTVDVGFSHAVMGPPTQRCWIEQVPAQPGADARSGRGAANVPGAVIGAVLGGILGHQVGGGTGKDIATVGGVVAGAAVGANVGRGGQAPPPQQDVQRCADNPGSARPAYWDVGYWFRGQEHRVQLSAPPGPTLTVNARGEPRV